MQDPPHDEGVAHAVTEAREVPAIEVVRTQAESSVRAGALPAKEEDEEAKGESLGGHLIEAPKVTHEWIGLSSLPLPLCNRLVILDVVL